MVNAQSKMMLAPNDITKGFISENFFPVFRHV